MQTVRLENVEVDDNNFIKHFFITLNFDLGTQANPEHVLFNIVYFVKKKLQMNHDEQIYINEYGVKFDWQQFYLHVCMFE